ncbi:hypothetical protein R6Q59_011130 [Mikania micrantha]
MVREKIDRSTGDGLVAIEVALFSTVRLATGRIPSFVAAIGLVTANAVAAIGVDASRYIGRHYLTRVVYGHRRPYTLTRARKISKFVPGVKPL